MKKGIHPPYAPTEIRCACGAVIGTRSTRENMTVQICSSCHPFFTGKQKLVDTAGRIDRFRRKFGGKMSAVPKASKAKSKTAPEEPPEPAEPPAQE